MPVATQREAETLSRHFRASADFAYSPATCRVVTLRQSQTLYERYIQPITILSILPSAGVGALLALMLTHTELTVIAVIGIILLIGIVKKNAIMMVDFTLAAERKEGKNKGDSIYEACMLRVLPILMTTIATILGVEPLALGKGTGSEFRRPSGIAIVGG